MHTPSHKQEDHQKQDPRQGESKEQIPIDPETLERVNPIFIFSVTELAADTFANEEHIPKQRWVWLRTPDQLNGVQPYPNRAIVYELEGASILERYTEIKAYAMTQNCDWRFPIAKEATPGKEAPKRESLHPPVSQKMQEPANREKK